MPIGDQLYAWHFANCTWTELEPNGPSPGPRIGHTAVAIGTVMYVFGGRTGEKIQPYSLKDDDRALGGNNAYASFATGQTPDDKDAFVPDLA